ncbi:MAG: hypothetical protein DSM106950_45755 [Stigonema ocellatum SAG 48.90 = DSM 106950]|nr:hypothetical protein [Stigonema ocellatum SAG 48.90 = DSM 106950]
MTTNPPSESRLDQLAALMEDTAEVVLAHDAALTRIEASIQQLVTTTTQNSQRIEMILEYLFQDRPNGRGNQ